MGPMACDVVEWGVWTCLPFSTISGHRGGLLPRYCGNGIMMGPLAGLVGPEFVIFRFLAKRVIKSCHGLNSVLSIEETTHYATAHCVRNIVIWCATLTVLKNLLFLYFCCTCPF